jgi:integrase/recombinase XerD
MTDPKSLFDKFILDKTYIDRLTLKSLKTYQQSWDSFNRHGGSLSTDGIHDFIVNASKAGLAPGSINTIARSINSFLTWMREHRYISESLKVPQIRKLKRVLTTYSVEDAKRLLNYNPKTFGERRLIAILHSIVHCGLRVNEALTLAKTSVDWNTGLIRVSGKGGKYTTVAISEDCRKILWRYQSQHDSGSLLFASRRGKQVDQTDLRRDLLRLLEKLGVQKPESSFHAFRRFSAKLFVRSGGDVPTLSRLLGHSDSRVTIDHYLEPDEEAIALTHRRHSPLDFIKSKR